MEDRPIGVDDSSSIDLALQFGLAKGTDESHDAADGQGGSGVVVDLLTQAVISSRGVGEGGRTVAQAGRVVQLRVQVQLAVTRIVQGCDRVVTATDGPVEDPIRTPASGVGQQIHDVRVRILLNAVRTVCTYAPVGLRRTDRRNDLYRRVRAEAHVEVPHALGGTHMEQQAVVAVGRSGHTIAITVKIQCYPVLAVP